MMHFRRWRLRGFLLLVLVVGTASAGTAQFVYYMPEGDPTSVVQVGARVSQLRPRNAFGKDFSRAPAYELYVQLRNNHGEGRFTGRMGIFYSDLKPRLDTLPVYATGGIPNTVFPGYLVYRKLYLEAIFLDVGTTVFRHGPLRVDVGIGLMGGKYHVEYSEAYATVVDYSDVRIEEYITGLRPRLNVGYQLGRHVQVYAEYMDQLISANDWSSNFNNDSFGLGVNVSFNRSDDAD